MNSEIKFYTCAMHPEVRESHEGICSICGMKLIPSGAEDEKHGEINRHAGHSARGFLRKFWISLALTIPVVLYSDILEKLFDFSAPVFFGSKYISAALGSIVFFYGGWIFLRGAWREIKARAYGMMTLIGLAITTAYLYSVYAILTGGDTLFWELTTLITVMLLGHWMEMRSVSGAQRALQELSKLLPDTAELLLENSKSQITNSKQTANHKFQTKFIPLAELKEGDIVFVRPGGRVPADGVVIDGRSEANESLLTGESAPVLKEVGKEVVAGSINGDGALKIKVTKIGAHTFLAGVMRLVAEAQASKSKLQLLSDRAAYYLTLIAIFGGLITFITWLIIPLAGETRFAFAIERAVAVLVIACPHALGLAVPLVAALSTTMAARNGFLVRQRLALEQARAIDVVLFDKTGTLTKGEYAVAETLPNPKLQITNSKLLQLAASIDVNSEHFVAKAIVAEARNNGIEFLKIDDFQRLPGKGVRGVVDGKEVLVGGRAILSDAGVEIPIELEGIVSERAGRGETIIFIIVDNQLAGAIALGDLIREESRQAISELKKSGVKVAMITGDSQEVAEWVAEELGIDEYFARVLPNEKALKVKTLQERGLKVAMIGDGINDAPALAQADLGIAIGAGTNVAIESAGIILVRNDPRDIPKIIRLSRLTYAKMMQNLFWATGYNVVALPLAAGVLAFQGITLQPALAALFMSLSTVIVAINALLIKNRKI